MPDKVGRAPRLPVAQGIGADPAVEFVSEDSLELHLAAAGRPLVVPEPSPTPPGWGRADPAWGAVVEPFLEERGRF
ncbi:MAG: hypothetical protein ABR573_08335 [Candidatus Dormibacteria bacterium]